MHAAGLLVWIKSDDGNIIFTAPAILNKSSPSRDLVVSLSVADPGVYTVHLVAHETKQLAEGARGTVATILPVEQGQLKMWAVPSSQMPPSSTSARVDTRGPMPETKILLPKLLCKLPTQGDGRWVRCAAAGILPRHCLRDGWVFVPVACRQLILSPAELLLRAKVALKATPLWMVIGGSSIERGTFHAGLDLLGGLRHHSNATNLLRNYLFEGDDEMPGQGSIRKCWGWSDVQIGHLRLSYTDFRFSRCYDPRNASLNSYGQQQQKRLTEIMSEGSAGPDMIVLTSLTQKTELLARFAVEAMANVPRWRGTMVLAGQKNRFLSGGIKMDYLGAAQKAKHFKATPSVASQPEMPTVLSLAEIGADVIAGQLDKCGARCNHIAQPDDDLVGESAWLTVYDEQLMGWAFVFDMERPMSNPTTSQHFNFLVTGKNSFPPGGVRHRATAGNAGVGGVSAKSTPKLVPATQLGFCSDWQPDALAAAQSSSVDTQVVFGAVVEMSVRTFLGHLVSKSARWTHWTSEAGPTQLRTNQAVAKELCKTNRVPVVPVRVCADCPEKACCPWVPPQSNPCSISSIGSAHHVHSLGSLEMRSCYDSFHTGMSSWTHNPPT